MLRERAPNRPNEGRSFVNKNHWFSIPLLSMALACSSSSTSDEPGHVGVDAAVDAALDQGAQLSKDPCEVHLERAGCCSDPACGWHHGIFDPNYKVPSCVDRDRVCEVDGVKVRDCTDGQICHGFGLWKTEDDCAALPPSGVINLNGRGICVDPLDDAGN